MVFSSVAKPSRVCSGKLASCAAKASKSGGNFGKRSSIRSSVFQVSRKGELTKVALFVMTLPYSEEAGRREVASPGVETEDKPRTELPRLSPISICELLITITISTWSPCVLTVMWLV